MYCCLLTQLTKNKGKQTSKREVQISNSIEKNFIWLVWGHEILLYSVEKENTFKVSSHHDWRPVKYINSLSLSLKHIQTHNISLSQIQIYKLSLSNTDTYTHTISAFYVARSECLIHADVVQVRHEHQHRHPRHITSRSSWLSLERKNRFKY